MTRTEKPTTPSLASPNFLAFFNVASGGTRNGIHLLSDSNLDWGQDLPLLAAWQRGHPDRTLYLDYFGTADPAFYWIKYHNLAGGYRFGPAPEQPTGDAVVAFGATQLQGVHLPSESRKMYERYREMRPTAILGGSIYLFDLCASR